MIQMSDTLAVGKKLVELCKIGKFEEAVVTLYSEDVVSIEAMGSPENPAVVTGLDAVKKKGEWWVNNHEIHSVKVEGPWPNGDRFIVRFIMDVTGKAGPMAGKRMQLDETGLYTVKDGKVSEEAFFYSMGE